jgi:hypothetical protein
MSNETMLLADDLFDDVQKRIKTNTIRYGHRNVRKGLLMIEATNKTRPPMKMHVTSVKKCLFRELKIDDLRHEGIATTDATFAEDLKNFMETMRRFYPDITMDSPVTVINFRYDRSVRV